MANASRDWGFVIERDLVETATFCCCCCSFLPFFKDPQCLSAFYAISPEFTSWLDLLAFHFDGCCQSLLYSIVVFGFSDESLCVIWWCLAPYTRFILTLCK